MLPMSPDTLVQNGISYVTAKAAAPAAGISADYITKLCRKGDVNAVVVGSTWYVDEASLADFVARKEAAKREHAARQASQLKEVHRRSGVVDATADTIAQPNSAPEPQPASYQDPKPPATPLSPAQQLLKDKTARATAFAEREALKRGNRPSAVALATITLLIATSASAFGTDFFRARIAATASHLSRQANVAAMSATSFANALAEKIPSLDLPQLPTPGKSQLAASSLVAPIQQAIDRAATAVFDFLCPFFSACDVTYLAQTKTQQLATSRVFPVQPHTANSAPASRILDDQPSHTARPQHPPIATAPTSQDQQQQPTLIERIIERTQTGITEQLLDTRLAALETYLTGLIDGVELRSDRQAESLADAFSGGIGGGGFDDVDITDSTFTGGTITGASIDGYLPLSGGSLSGDLAVGGSLTAGTLSVAGIASGGAVAAPYFTATLSTASNFPYASTTALSATTICFSSDCISAWPTFTDTAFSTTSAEYWKSVSNFFSTTSNDYWSGQRNFFSTTSADFWESQQAPRGTGFSTTSADYWKSVTDFFSTTSAQYLLSVTDLFSTSSASHFLAQNQGAAFSTTSASYFLSQNGSLGFSTTSADYWQSQRNFFSTSSALYFAAQGLAFSTSSSDFWQSQRSFFATTSSDYWLTQRNFFSTTSTDYWRSVTDLFSTTSTAYFVSVNQGSLFSTTSANYFGHSSTTIPKTYTANVFTALQSFSNASSSVLSADTLCLSSDCRTQWPTAGFSFAYPFPSNATTTSLGFYASTTIGNGTQSGGLTIFGGATTTGSLIVQGAATSTFDGGISITGSIIPTADDTYSLGSPDLAWHDVFIGPGSLYVNGKKVIEDVSNVITFSTDSGQNLAIETAGTGNINTEATGSGNLNLLSGSGNISITSTSGNLNIGTSGSGQLNLGTITAGIWHGTAIGAAYGGTGSTTLSGILKGNGMGVVQTAIPGADYLLPSSLAGYANFGYLFPSNATSTPLAFNGGLTASALTLGTLEGPLHANAGVLSATTSIGVLYGGTGLTTAPSYGQLLVGNASGGYTLTATSSLGIFGGGSDTGNVPAGTIAAFASTECPAGWAEYEPARGRFLRGIDNGAGIDPDGTRAPGDLQDDAFQGHAHASYYSGTDGASGSTGRLLSTTANNNQAPTNTVRGAITDGVNGTPRTSSETRPSNVAVLFCEATGSAALENGQITSGLTGQVPYYGAGGTTLSATSSLFISPSGNVGIGSTSPSRTLTVSGTSHFTSNMYIGVGDENPVANVVAGIVLTDTGVLNINRTGGTPVAIGRSNDGTVISVYSAGTSEGSISISGTTVSYNAFTGSHYATTDQTIERGMLVSLTGEQIFKHGTSGSEPTYRVVRTAQENDPAVFGSYLALMEPEQPHDPIENPHLIMAVGNGDMWVVQGDEDSIEPGDYLISSSVPGHAMKDPGTHLVSHIVARAAQRVEWDDIATTTTDGSKRTKISVTFEQFDRNAALSDLFAAMTSRPATSTVSSTDEATEVRQFAESFLGGLFTRLAQWFADAQNGIRDLFAKHLHAENITAHRAQFEELCLGSVCVTESQFMAVFGASASPLGTTQTQSGAQQSQTASAATTQSGASSPSNIPTPATQNDEQDSAEIEDTTVQNPSSDLTDSAQTDTENWTADEQPESPPEASNDNQPPPPAAANDNPHHPSAEAI